MGRVESLLLKVKPPTGEPDAGNPPVRFGGRGDRLNRSFLPLSHKSATFLSTRSCGEKIRRTKILLPFVKTLFFLGFRVSFFWLFRFMGYNEVSTPVYKR